MNMNFFKKVMTFFSILWNAILWRRTVKDKKAKSADKTEGEEKLLGEPYSSLEEDQGFEDIPLHSPIEPFELEKSDDDQCPSLVHPLNDSPELIFPIVASSAVGPPDLSQNVLELLDPLSTLLEKYNSPEAVNEEFIEEETQKEDAIPLGTDPLPDGERGGQDDSVGASESLPLQSSNDVTMGSPDVLDHPCPALNGASCSVSELKPVIDDLAETVSVTVGCSMESEQCPAGYGVIKETSSTMSCGEAVTELPQLTIDDAIEESIELLENTPPSDIAPILAEEVLIESSIVEINDQCVQKDEIEESQLSAGTTPCQSECKMLLPMPLDNYETEVTTVGGRSGVQPSVSSPQLLEDNRAIPGTSSNSLDKYSTNYMVKSDSLVNFLPQNYSMDGVIQPETKDGDTNETQDEVDEYESKDGVLEEIMCTSKGILKLSDDKIHDFAEVEPFESSRWVSTPEENPIIMSAFEETRSYETFLDPSETPADGSYCFDVQDEGDGPEEVTSQEDLLPGVKLDEFAPSVVEQSLEVEGSHRDEMNPFINDFDEATVAVLKRLTLGIDDDLAPDATEPRIDGIYFCMNERTELDDEQSQLKQLRVHCEDENMNTNSKENPGAYSTFHSLLPNLNSDGEFIPRLQVNLNSNCNSKEDALLPNNQSRLDEDDLSLDIQIPAFESNMAWHPTGRFGDSGEQDQEPLAENVSYVPKNETCFFTQKHDGVSQEAPNSFQNDTDLEEFHPFLDCSSYLFRIPDEIRKYEHFNPCVGAPPSGRFLYGKNVDGETVRFEGGSLEEQSSFRKHPPADQSIGCVPIQPRIGEEPQQGKPRVYRQMLNKIPDGSYSLHRQIFHGGCGLWNTPEEVPALEQRQNPPNFGAENYDDNDYRIVSHINTDNVLLGGNVQAPSYDNNQDQIQNGYGFVNPYGDIVFPMLNLPNIPFCPPQYPTFVSRDPVPPLIFPIGPINVEPLENQMEAEEERPNYPITPHPFWVGFQDEERNEEEAEENAVYPQSDLSMMEECSYLDPEDDDNDDDSEECPIPDPYFQLAENTSLHTVKSKADSYSGSLFCESLRSILSHNTDNENMIPSMSCSSVRCLNPSLALQSCENSLSNDSLPSIIVDENYNKNIDEDYLATEKFMNDVNTALNESVMEQIHGQESQMHSNMLGRGDGETCGMDVARMTMAQLELDGDSPENQTDHEATGEHLSVHPGQSHVEVTIEPKDIVTRLSETDEDVDAVGSLCNDIVSLVVDNVVNVVHQREELSEFISGLERHDEARDQDALEEEVISSQGGDEVVVVQHVTLDPQMAPKWVQLGSGMVLDINGLSTQFHGSNTFVGRGRSADESSMTAIMKAPKRVETEYAKDLTYEGDMGFQDTVEPSMQSENLSKPKRNRRRKKKGAETHAEPTQDEPTESGIGDGSDQQGYLRDKAHQPSSEQVDKEQELTAAPGAHEEPTDAPLDDDVDDQDERGGSVADSSNNRKRRNRRKKRKN